MSIHLILSYPLCTIPNIFYNFGTILTTFTSKIHLSVTTIIHSTRHTIIIPTYTYPHSSLFNTIILHPLTYIPYPAFKICFPTKITKSRAPRINI